MNNTEQVKDSQGSPKCRIEGCNNIAPDPGTLCDTHLRRQTSFENKVDWYSFEGSGL